MAVTYDQALRICDILAPLCESRAGRGPYSKAMTAAEITPEISPAREYPMSPQAASALMMEVMEVINTTDNSPYLVGLYPLRPKKYVVARVIEEEKQRKKEERPKLYPTRFEREDVI